MRGVRLLVAMVLLAACWHGQVVAQITPEQAVNEARAMPRPDPRTVMTPSNASSTVPQYGADVSAQSGLFQGGNGLLVPPGVTRLSQCMAAADPECIAVQLVATGRATRPSFTISPTDPLITGAVSIVRNADTVVGPAPGGLTPGFQTCTTTTQVTPPTYADQTCEIVTPDSENTCFVTRDIQVDADANYRCSASPNRLQTLYCDKIRNVTVSWTTQCQIDSFAELTQHLGTTIGSAYCGADLQAHFTFRVDPSYECHERLCNSTYYTIDAPLRQGVPASGSTMLGGDYRCGGAPCYITMYWSWDGVDRVVVTDSGDSRTYGAPTYMGTGYLLPLECPAGSTGVLRSMETCTEGGCYPTAPQWACSAPFSGSCPAGFNPSYDVYGNVTECLYWPWPGVYKSEFRVVGGSRSVPTVTEEWINNCAALEARQ